MIIKALCTTLVFSLMLGLAGCKEDKVEVASPDCANPVTASDATKCPRGEGNIIRSKPQTWSLDNEK